MFFLSCDNDTEKTELLHPEIPTALNNKLPLEKKPLELVWSDEFDGVKLELTELEFRNGLWLPRSLWLGE